MKELILLLVVGGSLFVGAFASWRSAKYLRKRHPQMSQHSAAQMAQIIGMMSMVVVFALCTLIIHAPV